jgi:hypothetical protein
MAGLARLRSRASARRAGWRVETEDRSRPSTSWLQRKTWMRGTSPRMTECFGLSVTLTSLHRKIRISKSGDATTFSRRHSPELLRLAALHGDFDRLKPGSEQFRQLVAIMSSSMLRGPRLPSDQARPFERQHHLVNRWWADAEVFPHVGFGRGKAVQACVEVDIGQVLALVGGESFFRATHAGHPIQLVIRASTRGGTDQRTPSGRTEPKQACRFHVRTLNEDRPLFALACIWTTFNGDRGTKSKPIPGPHQVYGFLTTATRS